MRKSPTNVTTELATERNRAAAERTLTSWIQNCVALIGFGLAFDRIFSALRTAPDGHPYPFADDVPYVALTAIGFGVFLLALAVVVHENDVRRLEYDERRYEAVSLLSEISAIAVALFGLVALASLFVRFN